MSTLSVYLAECVNSFSINWSQLPPSLPSKEPLWPAAARGVTGILRHTILLVKTHIVRTHSYLSVKVQVGIFSKLLTGSLSYHCVPRSFVATFNKSLSYLLHVISCEWINRYPNIGDRRQWGGQQWQCLQWGETFYDTQNLNIINTWTSVQQRQDINTKVTKRIYFCPKNATGRTVNWKGVHDALCRKILSWSC